MKTLYQTDYNDLIKLPSIYIVVNASSTLVVKLSACQGSIDPLGKTVFVGLMA